MDKSSLEKLWTVVHLAAICAGINAILWLQSSPVTLPLNVSMRDGASRGEGSMAVFWFFIAGVMLACSLLLALSYVKHHGQNRPGVAAAPSMFGLVLDENQGKALARSYQGFWLVLCMLPAVYGVGHAARTVLQAPLYECDAKAAAVVPDATFRKSGGIAQGLWPRFGGADVRFDGCGPNASGPSRSDKRGVDYVPIVNDVLIGGLALFDIALLFVFWWRWYVAARA